MKILITGVFGFIGHSIFLHLKKKHKVLGLGTNTKNHKVKNNKQLKVQSITKINLINLNFEADIIIHCAGSGSVINSMTNKKLDYDKNVNTTKEVIKYIKQLEYKPKVIMFSSAAVYGNDCYKNNKKLRPISPYGKNKLIAEKLLRLNSQKLKFKLIILRFYSIYGKELRKQLIWDACKKINQKINIFFGNGNEVRSWINIKDVNNFLEFLIKKNIKRNITLDVSGGDTINNKDLLQRLFKLLNFSENPYFNKEYKKGDPKKQIYNNIKLKNYGWKPKVTLLSGLKEYVQWFKIKIKK